MNEAETKYKETALIKMTKNAYYETKKEEKNPGRMSIEWDRNLALKYV